MTLYHTENLEKYVNLNDLTVPYPPFSLYIISLLCIPLIHFFGNSDQIYVLAINIAGVALYRKMSGIVNLCTSIGTSVGDAAKRMILESGFEIPEDKIVSGNSDFPTVLGSNQKLLAALPNLNLEWKPSKYFE